MDHNYNKSAENGGLVPMRPAAAKALYDLAMIERKMGLSEFIYDKELDVFRFPDGRFVCGKEDADWALLRERGYLR